MNWSAFEQAFANPWNLLERLTDEMAQMNEGYDASSAALKVNIWANEELVTVQAAVPGVDPNGIDVSVKGTTLMISAERRDSEAPTDSRVVRRERHAGRLARTLELPFAVEADKVSARCERGILTIELPRADSDKPKTIRVMS